MGSKRTASQSCVDEPAVKFSPKIAPTSSRQNIVPFSRVSSIDWHSRYLQVAKAGSGDNGEAFFVLPRSSLPSESSSSSKSEVLTSSQDQPKPLPISEQMCVVKSSKKTARNEIALHKRLSPHPRICTLLAHDPGYKWLAMESIRGGNLFKYITLHELSGKPVPEGFVWHVFIQLMEAIAHVHSKEIAHCDLVGLNVMLDPEHCDIPGLPNVKLIDFGWACSRNLPYVDHDKVDAVLQMWHGKDLEALGDLVHEVAHAEVYGAKARRARDGICGCVGTRTCGAGGDNDLFSRIMAATVGWRSCERYDEAMAELEDVLLPEARIRRDWCLKNEADGRCDVIGELNCGGMEEVDVLAAIAAEMKV